MARPESPVGHHLQKTIMDTYPVSHPIWIKYPSCDHSDVVGASNVNKEEEANEMSIVEMPHAIINPRTMMICYAPVNTMNGMKDAQHTHSQYASAMAMSEKASTKNNCGRLTYYTVYSDGYEVVCSFDTSCNNAVLRWAFWLHIHPRECRVSSRTVNIKFTSTRDGRTHPAGWDASRICEYA